MNGNGSWFPSCPLGLLDSSVGLIHVGQVEVAAGHGRWLMCEPTAPVSHSAGKRWKKRHGKGPDHRSGARWKEGECGSLEWKRRVVTVWGVWLERRVKVLHKILRKRSAAQYGMKRGGPGKFVGRPRQTVCLECFKESESGRGTVPCVLRAS